MGNVVINDPSSWATGANSLLRRLGIPQFAKWFLSDTVVPITLVDSQITLPATALTPLFGSPATAGEQVAPAANTVLADTGQLAAGNWTILCVASHSEALAVIQSWRLQRRDAANAADIWAMRMFCSNGGQNPFVFGGRFSVAQNERFRLLNATVGTGGTIYQASIFSLAG